ncbi:oxygen-independent coproporphyrinogen-3 oxidase [Loktanella fryxellensis]|uniref:Coproporphyrinogen-III oxidase n=1 Tax=Loktanella fryxellensis TaxID=245187 RepID=A0A1H8HAN0_9RHOB|nr:oxygen-independent coproporphyrinogen III oxidase [Loktanella fryxellensis]SEN53371.1 oxygen-independent coproporphyrinogen-3 oxidase [Loktanella fryxellensis]
MDTADILQRHGLFDAQVPRYTSYPPANHFVAGAGQRHQADWLRAVPPGTALSVYVHVPFCRRLCLFCACRTQGTSTMRPLNDYVTHLTQEIAAVRRHLPDDVRMGRLHLGGGTPTILPVRLMTRLLDALDDAFATTDDAEFSVEIDPTDAAPELLHMLAARGLTRASIGVQDFAPQVQAAIGRPQSLGQTQEVIDTLRSAGVAGLNIDLLYGLPHQTADSFRDTLAHVRDMAPDRLAIYGYAHVPWMSKRQVLIPTAALPDAAARWALAQQAHRTMTQAGYAAIGIDHFARPGDGLALADAAGTLRRNFQGYTDDPCPTLIGFGASAISRLGQGYVQNAVATSAWTARTRPGGLTGHRGYELTGDDAVIAAMIADLMCRFRLDLVGLRAAHSDHHALIARTARMLLSDFPDVFGASDDGIYMHAATRPLVRIVAHRIDALRSPATSYSSAI